MNYVDLICIDTETSGLKCGFSEVLSIAGKAYKARTLEPYPPEEGGEFYSLMKPLHWDRLEPGAMKVNGIKEEELREAPDQKVVWLNFIHWVSKFNKKKTPFTAPIACGKNIRSFDLPFIQELNRLYAPKGAKQMLFSTRRQVDLEDYIFLFFENSTELPNEKMDTLRDYFGIPHEGAHNALVDVRQEGELIMKFIRMSRELRKKTCRDGKPLIQFGR